MKTRNIKFINELFTEKIKSVVGDITLEIVHQDPFSRISLIKDINEKSVLLAITRFSQNSSKEILKLQENIRRGAYIGETFIQSGYDFIREIKVCFLINTPIYFDQNVPISKCLYSLLYLRKDGITAFYGELCEIFSITFHNEVFPIFANIETIKSIEELLKIANLDTTYF